MLDWIALVVAIMAFLAVCVLESENKKLREELFCRQVDRRLDEIDRILTEMVDLGKEQ